MQITQSREFLCDGTFSILFCTLLSKFFENANYGFEITWPRDLHFLKCLKRRYKIRCKTCGRMKFHAIACFFLLFSNILENGFQVDQINHGMFLISIKKILTPTLS